MIGVDEARDRLFRAAPAPTSETVPLAEGAGRVLAKDVAAKRTQPPFNASAMDGYALSHADILRGPVRVVGEAVAGKAYGRPLGRGEAVRIFTGAPVPEGADTVLIQEDAVVEGTSLTTTASVSLGAHIRRQGLDFEGGAPLLQNGHRLTARDLALLGAGGHAHLTVAARPKVAFLATGDELVPPGTMPGPDQIVASVTPTLSAMVADAGGDSVDLGIVPDRQDAIEAAARDGLRQADLLVTLGGASVGDHDLIRPALEGLGIALDFWRVAVRPGKPLMFAPSPMVLGLPGNPVSSVVCSALFLCPLVLAMQGADDPGPAVLAGTLGAPVGQNGPRRDHMRARIDRDGRIVPFRVQDSSMLSTLAKANVLLVREPHEGPAEAGTPCRYIAL
ncbi:MAG: gephyrin-like molybdotransferase Glp [Pseudomonadota bacterium]